jgi:hypothetical protein
MTTPEKLDEAIERVSQGIDRVIAERDAALEACRLFTGAAHEVRDLLNAAGIACPSSIALAAEKARAAIRKYDEAAS